MLKYSVTKRTEYVRLIRIRRIRIERKDNSFLVFSRWPFRGGRAIRCRAYPRNRSLPVGHGIRSVRESGGPERAYRREALSVDSRGTAIDRRWETGASILHDRVRSRDTGKPEEGFRVSCRVSSPLRPCRLTGHEFSIFQHHIGEGKVVRRPWDSLHAEGARARRGWDLQHRANHRHCEIGQGIGFRGSSPTAHLLPYRYRHRGFGWFLHVRWGTFDTSVSPTSMLKTPLLSFFFSLKILRVITNAIWILQVFTQINYCAYVCCLNNNVMQV